MINILLVLVGGTICTSVNEDGRLSVDEKAGERLTKNFYSSNSSFADAVNFHLTENLYILSENMTTDSWNNIYKLYQENISKNKYDGVIFAHGTDTLAYTSSLFSILLNNTDIPVFFVSSNKKLDDDNSNGNDNFRCAVECICKGIVPNVYAVYKNISDGKLYIHLASRLRQCENYSEDFYSKGSILIGTISENSIIEALRTIEELYPPKKTHDLGINSTNLKICNCVLYIQPYVGINYDAYNYEKFKAVLHGSYHSGTACAEKSEKLGTYSNNSILHMIDKCAKSNVEFYIAPSKFEGETYDSIRIIGEHGVEKKIKFLNNMTNEMTYVKLLIAYSNFSSQSDIDNFIRTEYNYELF